MYKFLNIMTETPQILTSLKIFWIQGIAGKLWIKPACGRTKSWKIREKPSIIKWLYLKNRKVGVMSHDNKYNTQKGKGRREKGHVGQHNTSQITQWTRGYSWI